MKKIIKMTNCSLINSEYAKHAWKRINLINLFSVKKSRNSHIEREIKKLPTLSVKALLAIAIIKGEEEINKTKEIATCQPKYFLEKMSVISKDKTKKIKERYARDLKLEPTILNQRDDIKK
ncbi:MAG: hypothetical protein Q8O13_03380 [Candidatus Omnitrophota bacterium]|nr:hypothetical protein [Candidatus Omnitrophota bacterium]